MENRPDQGLTPGPDPKKSPRRGRRGPKTFRSISLLILAFPPVAQAHQPHQAGAQQEQGGRYGDGGDVEQVATAHGDACKTPRGNLTRRGIEREIKGTDKWCTGRYAEVFEQRRVFGVLEDRSGDIKSKEQS